MIVITIVSKQKELKYQPLIGKMILCEDSHRASFDTGNVDALDMNKNDDNNASDKDSDGNDIEKMPQKKIQKFVPEREHKGE